MSATINSRNPWPLAITGFFVAAIIFIVAFIAFAMRQREDLVSADYYEREVCYQSQLDSMNRSQSLATRVVITYEPIPRRIVITLPAAHSRGATGSVHLYRPSDARLDREVPLVLDADGIQHLDATKLHDGLWKVRVKWSANGQDYFLDQSVILTSS